MTTPDGSTTARAVPSRTAFRADEPHPTADTAAAETARVAATVLAPTVAAGLITRRPVTMQLAERFQLDQSAVRTLRKLRRDHHGRDVVLFTTTTFLAALLRTREMRLGGTGGARLEQGRIPATLNHFTLELAE